MSHRIKLFGIAALTYAALPLGATTVFSDTSFNLVSNYSETPTYKSNSSDIVSYSQCASCGDPGQGLQFLTTIPGNDLVAVGFINNTFAYNPGTQGAITGISASVDKNINTNLPIDPATTYTNTFRPLIEQDGVYYLAAILGPSFNGGDTGYNAISQSNLQATDFTSFDFTTGAFGTAHPNFSGDPMLLGLAQIAQFAGNTQFEGDYDNLNLTVNPAPEPGSLVLLAVGGLLLAFAVRTRLRRHRVVVRWSRVSGQ